MHYVLGIDLGTSSCKACAINLSGNLLATSSASIPTSIPNPGWAEQRCEDWIPAIIKATKHLLLTNAIPSEKIVGISLSSAAHIAVLLDSKRQPLRKAILWSDQRSLKEVEKLSSLFGDEILRSTYNEVSPTWSLPQLLWIRRHQPDLWSKVQNVLFSKDYISNWLTGEITTDPATAVSSLLFDANTESWSETLLQPLGLNTTQLPQVLPTTAEVGRLTIEASNHLGVPTKIPVINGTLDSAAETYGARVITPGQSLLRLATAGGIQLVLEQPQPHPQLITYPHPIRPLWYSQAGTNSCTSALNWVFQTIGSEKPPLFETWDESIKSIPPGTEGLFFHPYLSGERCPYWDGKLRASFTGATFKHSPAHFVRAAYEGIAFSLRDAFTILEKLGNSGGGITAVGGGTAGTLWTQIICDVIGKPLKVSHKVDSSYGAALLGLAGISGKENIAGLISKLPQQEKIFYPDPEKTDFYSNLFQQYKEIQHNLQPIYHQMKNT